MFYPSYEDYMRDIFYFNGLQDRNMLYSYSGFNNQNLNDYFPSIYKIVNPVIQKVVSGNNYQFTNEDSINNIVDVVLGITAGDLNLSENNDINRKTNTNTNNNSNNSSMQVQENREGNTLLKDLIKILTIKELQNRQNVRKFPYNYNSRVPYYMQEQNPYMMN